MEIIGIIHKIGIIENHGYNFQNRFFSIKYIDENKKEQFLKFKLSNGRVELIDSFAEGDKVKITFKLEGTEVKNDKKESVIYDRKEVYNIEGYTDLRAEQIGKETPFYKLKEGEIDQPLKLN